MMFVMERAQQAATKLRNHIDWGHTALQFDITLSRVEALVEENAKLKARVAELERLELQPTLAENTMRAKVDSLVRENAELRAQLAQHQPRVYDPADEKTWPTEADSIDAGFGSVILQWMKSERSGVMGWCQRGLAHVLHHGKPVLWNRGTPPDPTPEKLAELAAVTER